MKALLVSLLLLAAPGNAAEPSTAPEDVVRRYVQAWNDDALDTFLGQTAPNARTYRPSADPNVLIGELTPGSGDPVRRRATYQALFARQPRVRVDIIETMQHDDLVVSRERITGLPDGRTGEELTIYQVRDGLIRNVWHIRRSAK